MLVFLNDVLLSDDSEVGLVGEKREHNEVGIGSVEAMSCIGVIIWLSSELTDVIQHFVLSFSWDGSIGEHYRLEIFVQWVSIDFILDKEMEILAQVGHELGAR